MTAVEIRLLSIVTITKPGVVEMRSIALSVPTLAKDAPLEIAGAKTLDYRGATQQQSGADELH
jgi:hypothetical protein